MRAPRNECPSRSSFRDPSTNGPSAEDHATRQGLQRVVQRRRDAGGAGRLLAGARLHEIGRAHSELQSLAYLVCRLLLEKKKIAEMRYVVQYHQEGSPNA